VAHQLKLQLGRSSLISAAAYLPSHHNRVLINQLTVLVSVFDNVLTANRRVLYSDDTPFSRCSTCFVYTNRQSFQVACAFIYDG